MTGHRKSAAGELWDSIQSWLFPVLEDEIGELDEKHRQFVAVCELCAPQDHMAAYQWIGNGCPPSDRLALCKAFIAKAVWDFPSTRDLIDAVRHRPALRRLCGWESLGEVPSEATFSRACGAYAVYGRLATAEFGPPPVDLIGCWAHVRRYFREAHLSSHPAEGAAFMHLIGLLYAVERDHADTVPPGGATAAERAALLRADDARRLALRTERSLPVLAQIREKIDALTPSTPPSSKLGKALSYADKIWHRLTAYAEDGRLPIDNNPAEQMIRPIAVGRNNWLFFGSERGGQAAANWMSVIATCKRAGVEPFAYLSDVLRRLPSAKTGSGVRELLPDVWKPL